MLGRVIDLEAARARRMECGRRRVLALRDTRVRFTWTRGALLAVAEEAAAGVEPAMMVPDQARLLAFQLLAWADDMEAADDLARGNAGADDEGP